MSVYHQDDTVTLHVGNVIDVLRTLPDQSVDCCVTSPPYYGLRSYLPAGHPDKIHEIGTEKTPAEFVERLRMLFAEVRRVLADDGTCWVVLGDTFNSTSAGQNGTGATTVTGGAHDRLGGRRSRLPDPELPTKNLLGIPWRVAFALQDDGWTLRNSIIWHKTNGMPESVTDRLSSRHEMLFMFSKARRYWFDLDPIREPHAETTVAAAARARKPYEAPGQTSQQKTRGMAEGGANPGDVWSISTSPFPGAHFAVFPPEIPRRCISAGCKPGGTVIDPFSGSGTTGMVAQKLGRKYIRIDLNPEYLALSLRTRLAYQAMEFPA